MAAITMQRDLVEKLKKKTIQNVGILSKIKEMPSQLSRLVLKENGLEKPTQNVFNHLSHYLICIIDLQAASTLAWPLYDSKTERAYRNQLSTLLCQYSNKGLLSPVMSSYLVNPGCYKVTMLMFQMSQLAVQKVLESVMQKDSQKNLYKVMTKKYKLQDDDFLAHIQKETDRMLSKFSNYLVQRKALEDVAAKLRDKIARIESKLSQTKAQTFLDDLVNGFISRHNLDNETKAYISEIRNVNKPACFFDNWLLDMDRNIDDMESKWNEKVSPFLQLCKETQTCTEELISRRIGTLPKDTYTIEYNHKSDEICTTELEKQVIPQQKYILNNIIKEERLSFPNLIRGFLISICYILKESELGDEIYTFNECLSGAQNKNKEMIVALKDIIERVNNAEAKIQPSSPTCDESTFLRDVPKIRLLPDLSDLLTVNQPQCQVMLDTFTPLGLSKRQFNYRTSRFTKPQSKSLLVTPFCHPSKDNFMKSLLSCRVSNYDCVNITQNFHNMSVISQCNRANETISEGSQGFTKQQIFKLLTTKKSSSSKKFKYGTERPDIKVKKLFASSTKPVESSGLYRSYSSPNLNENSDTQLRKKGSCRKLSVMQEDIMSSLDVSGITALDKEISCSTLKSPNIDGSRISTDTDSLPIITVTQANNFHENLRHFNVDLKKELASEPIKSNEVVTKMDTPKMEAQQPRKSNSIERLIHRYKKLQAHMIPEDNKAEKDIGTIIEEKANSNICKDMFSVKRDLLPDLVSPSCSNSSKVSVEYMEQLSIEIDEKICWKPRESLGTALGVDHTFLDQFDLID